jgi:hypothetical protein
MGLFQGSFRVCILFIKNNIFLLYFLPFRMVIIPFDSKENEYDNNDNREHGINLISYDENRSIFFPLQIYNV